MKILVTGASGYLGEIICTIFPTHGFTVKGIDINDVDVRDQNKVYKIIKTFCPQIIIHLAALTDIDECEKKSEIAFQVNVKGTCNIVNAAKRVGAKVIYLSSDYVFDGYRGNYTETDIANPINVYGKTKSISEQIIKREINRHLIIRSSSFYGHSPSLRGFASEVIYSLYRNKKIYLAIDQIANPTDIKDLANAMIVLIKKNVLGICHVIGSQQISRYEFAMMIAKLFGFDPTLIISSTLRELSLKYRPANISLRYNKLNNFGIEMNNIHKGLYNWNKMKMKSLYFIRRNKNG